jgi:periplasmic protein TonB
VNRTIPLSLFMPYGAPELIAAAPRYMARAVITSSMLAVAAFFFALFLAPNWVPPPLRVIAVDPIDFAPPISIERVLPPPPVALAQPRGEPDDGAILPVPETREPALPPAPETRTGSDADGTKTIDAPIAPSTVGIKEERLPDRDEFVLVDELPASATEIRPDYPPIAREVGIEGLVVVHVLVGKDGHVMKAEVNEKFSIPVLNEAALGAARRWVFTPALRNNHPVPVWVALRFNFKLH